LETFSRFTTWHLKCRLEKYISIGRIKLCDNEFDQGIIAFNRKNFKIGGVHGHLDKPGVVVNNLTMMTKNNYDLICTAHLHHFSCDEQNETLVISNGSLMGVDEYAKTLRLTNKASQNLIIMTDDNVAEAIFRIPLN